MFIFFVTDVSGDELWQKLAERIDSTYFECDTTEGHLMMAETYCYQSVAFKSFKV